MKYLLSSSKFGPKTKGPQIPNAQQIQIQIQQYQSRGSHAFKTQEPNSNAYISKYHRFPRAQNLDQISELQNPSLFLSILSHRSSLRGGREGHVPLARSRCSSAQIKIFGIVLLQFFFFVWCISVC